MGRIHHLLSSDFGALKKRLVLEHSSIDCFGYLIAVDGVVLFGFFFFLRLFKFILVSILFLQVFVILEVKRLVEILHLLQHFLVSTEHHQLFLRQLTKHLGRQLATSQHGLLLQHGHHVRVSGLRHHVVVLNHDALLRHLVLSMHLLPLMHQHLLLLSLLLLLKNGLSLEEPLRIALNLGLRWIEGCIAHTSAILSNVQLLRILTHVLPMHLPHLFNLIQINDKAPLIGVVLLNALPAEDRLVVRAVEVLHSLVVFLAEEAIDAFFVLEIDISQDRISFDDFVKNVEVQRQLVDGFNILNQLTADGAPDPEIVVQVTEALSAESVTAVDKDTRYLFAYGELITAIVAKVETTSLVVALNDTSHDCFTSHLFGVVAMLLFYGSSLVEGLDLLVIN